jgi:3-oxoadipate enol-lactonase
MRLQANGVGLGYDCGGPEGAPVVILHHSLSTNRHVWDQAARSLQEEGYRVLWFDARGHGQSDVPDGPYDFETLSKDVIALMDMLKIERAHYLGLSIGGMIGQHLGLLAPERFESLILVSTTSKIPEAGKAAWDERIAAVQERGMECQVQPTLSRWFTQPFLETGDPVIADVAQMIRRTPVKGYVGWGMAVRELDITDRLKDIKLPALVIVGEEDPGTTVDAAQAIHDNLPESELRIMDGASHQLSLERPQEFHNMVTSFLAVV